MRTEAEIDDFLSRQKKSFHRVDALTYFYSIGTLDKESFRLRLQNMYYGLVVEDMRWKTSNRNQNGNNTSRLQNVP